MDNHVMSTISKMLEQRGVKPTANRMLVMDALVDANHPLSLTDLETIMETMDKSSIFRALKLFLDHDLVHAIEDGSGAVKYEVCSGGESCSISDMHVHFYCEECHSTYCFATTQIPEVVLPDGFESRSVNYMVKGLCPHCLARKR